MAIGWKLLEEIMHKEYEQYNRSKDWLAPSSCTLAEVQRLLWCTRKYKEMMREYGRFMRKNGVKDWAALVQRMADIQTEAHPK